MPTILNSVEVRVLGALVEKQVTTPEYYPLTLNALVQACNQKNNRDPVVAFDEAIVTRALETLRDKNLVYVFYGSGSRVPKYKHMMREVYELDAPRLALINVLMLRGAQTVGELRERASRLHEFAHLSEVEETLETLAAHGAEALVARLPRRAGHKEARYVHLLAGADITEQSANEQLTDEQFISARSKLENAAPKRAESDRMSELEQRVETLTSELNDLRQRFEEFKNQFG